MTDTLDLEELKRLAAKAEGYSLTVSADPLGDYLAAAVNSLPALIAIAEEVERLRAGLTEMTNAYRDARRLLDSAERYHRQGDGI